MFNGLFANIVGLGIVIISIICFLIALIMALVFKRTLNIPVFKQRSGAFIIGSFFQFTCGLGLFLAGFKEFTESSSARRELDDTCLYLGSFIMLVSAALITGLCFLFSKKYYPQKKIISALPEK